MTTEADKSAEPKEEIQGNLLLTAVALKLSFFSPCPLDILAVTANAKFVPVCCQTFNPQQLH